LSEGWDVEGLSLQVIDVDVDDLCVSFWVTSRGKSGYVTIDYLDEIGGVVVIIVTVAKFQQSSVIG
jgi:hypothetical protein